MQHHVRTAVAAAIAATLVFVGTAAAATWMDVNFANYNAHEMLGSIRYAKYVYYSRRREWNKIIDRAMAADFSWKTSAAKYQELYDWLIG